MLPLLSCPHKEILRSGIKKIQECVGELKRPSDNEYIFNQSISIAEFSLSQDHVHIVLQGTTRAGKTHLINALCGAEYFTAGSDTGASCTSRRVTVIRGLADTFAVKVRYISKEHYFKLMTAALHMGACASFEADGVKIEDGVASSSSTRGAIGPSDGLKAMLSALVPHQTVPEIMVRLRAADTSPTTCSDPLATYQPLAEWILGKSDAESRLLEGESMASGLTLDEMQRMCNEATTDRGTSFTRVRY